MPRIHGRYVPVRGGENLLRDYQRRLGRPEAQAAIARQNQMRAQRRAQAACRRAARQAAIDRIVPGWLQCLLGFVAIALFFYALATAPH